MPRIRRYQRKVTGMTKGITGKEPNPRVVYADIIDLPHWQSPTRPHMSLYDRSAQFASYKALSGYEDMIQEEARLTDMETQLSERAMDILNQKLSLISDLITHPELTFRVFVPDKKKSGGKYVSITDTVKKIDTVLRKVILMGTEGRGKVNKAIGFDRITEIHGSPVDYLDDVEP